MILALEFQGLWVFDSIAAAAIEFEAIDVLEGSLAFCDEHGRRYVPFYTRMPHRRRWSWFGIGSVDIGAFRLNPTDDVDLKRPHQFLDQAEYLECSRVAGIDSLADLRRALAT